MTREQELIQTLESALIHANEWLQLIKASNGGDIIPYNWGFIPIEQALTDADEYKRQVSAPFQTKETSK